MANSTPYAVFLDIDGTILNPLYPDGLSPATCRVIADMQRRGHYFFLNTGRSPGYFACCGISKEKFDGVCAGLGTYAELHGKILYTDPIPDATVQELIEYCDRYKETCFIESDADGEDGRYSFRNDGAFHASRHWDEPAAFFKATLGRTFYKITIPYLPNAEYRAFLERHFDMIYCTEQKATPELRGEAAYAEGANRGCDKGCAVRRVCALLNIPVERSIAIGDSENDLGMLRAAGISVAMGSAPDEVKKQCDHVTDTVANDGAARAIVSLLGGDGKEYF